MRTLAARLAVLAGPVLGVVVLPAGAGHAEVALVACSVSQHGAGDVRCQYVATTTNGRTTAVIADAGYTEVDVECVVSGSGGWLGRSGSIDYNQIPGEICNVDVYVGRAVGSADVWAGSIVQVP